MIVILGSPAASSMTACISDNLVAGLGPLSVLRLDAGRSRPHRHAGTQPGMREWTRPDSCASRMQNESNVARYTNVSSRTHSAAEHARARSRRISRISSDAGPASVTGASDVWPVLTDAILRTPPRPHRAVQAPGGGRPLAYRAPSRRSRCCSCLRTHLACRQMPGVLIQR